MEEIDSKELLKFQAALLSELEKRGYILAGFTEDGFEIVAANGHGGKRYAKTTTFFKLYKQGKSIDEIAGYITNKEQFKEALKVKPEELLAMVKDLEFILKYEKMLESSLGGPLEPNHPSLPVIIQPWKGHEVYVLCGIDIGYGYTYLINSSFKELNISHRELYDKMIETLDKKIGKIISEKRYTLLKQAEGVHSIAFPDDLGPSFLLVAHKYFDFLEQASGIIGAEFFYAFTVTTEEILIVGPSVPPELLAFAANRIRERQEELSMRTQVHQIVSIEPVIITKKGLTFLTR
jgi:hypothetical protein